MKNGTENKGRLLLHEFGHSFGLLYDEYTEDGKEDRPGNPNCANSTEEAKKWWGDLAEKYDEVDYFNGCSYVEDNIRPTLNSIMRNHEILDNEFEKVNERQLTSRINDKTGGK